jgi:hypothetical protein
MLCVFFLNSKFSKDNYHIPKYICSYILFSVHIRFAFNVYILFNFYCCNESNKMLFRSFLLLYLFTIKKIFIYFFFLQIIGEIYFDRENLCCRNNGG